MKFDVKEINVSAARFITKTVDHRGLSAASVASMSAGFSERTIIETARKMEATEFWLENMLFTIRVNGEFICLERVPY